MRRSLGRAARMWITLVSYILISHFGVMAQGNWAEGCIGSYSFADEDYLRKFYLKVIFQSQTKQVGQPVFVGLSSLYICGIF